MSRRKRNFLKVDKCDTRYQNKNIGLFINKIMKKGKKSIAEKLVYTSLDFLAEKAECPPDEAFEKVLKNVMPQMEVKPRRVGGSTYQVPIEVKKSRGYALAMRWIIQNSSGKRGGMIKNLSNELIDAYNKTGLSLKKKDDTHKMAESNKAFAHFRW